MTTNQIEAALITAGKNRAAYREFDLNYYVAQTIKTRTFGHTYVHAGGRSQFQHGDITFFVEGYGRSLQSGGPKYKVKAYRDGKPVMTKELRAL